MTATSGDEAVAKLGSAGRVPDALICGWRLRQNESGFDVIRRLWEEFNHRIPALLITGDTSSERIQETLASGLPVLYKPVRGTMRQILQE